MLKGNDGCPLPAITAHEIPAHFPVHTCAVKPMYVESEPGVKFRCLYLFKSVLITSCQSHCKMKSSMNMTILTQSHSVNRHYVYQAYENTSSDINR